MNRQHETAFTHYTEITEAKQTDVRMMQAAVARSILRSIAPSRAVVIMRKAKTDFGFSVRIRASVKDRVAAFYKSSLGNMDQQEHSKPI